MIAAFIFDMDGVIVDSTSTHTEAWRRYLKTHGIEVNGIEGRMLGKHNGDIVRDFFGDVGLSEQEIFEHGARKEQLYRDLIQAELANRLVPGVVHFLDRHQNTLLGLATNAEPANVEFVLNSADIRKYFSAVVDGHQVERPKPYPDVYLKAASLLGVAPDRSVVFEDSPFGVQAARAAGMKVVGLTTTCAQLECRSGCSGFSRA